MIGSYRSVDIMQTDWAYLQSFGDNVPAAQVTPSDAISSVSFNTSGKLLATGDLSGRVVIFHETPLIYPKAKPNYEFAVQIQAHSEKYNIFRSELSKPDIHSLKWLPSESFNPQFITCNSSEAKLWRLKQSFSKEFSPLPQFDSFEKITLPQLTKTIPKYTVEPMATFSDIDIGYLVDLQPLSDQPSFLMVDSLFVKIWDLERSIPSVTLFRDQSDCYDLTASAVSSSIPSAFLIGDNSGLCRLFDMRQQAEGLTPSLSFNAGDCLSDTAEIEGFQAVGSLSFTPSGPYFVARMLKEAQVWDLRKSDSPVSKVNFNPLPKNAEWKDPGQACDYFCATVTPSGYVVTGKYGESFVSWKWQGGSLSEHRAAGPKTAILGGNFEAGIRVTSVAAHPTQGVVAIASTSSLFLFSSP